MTVLTKLSVVTTAMDECRIPGARPTSLDAPGLTREAALFKHWADQAWLGIQSARTDWNFLYKDFSFTTTASDEGYTPAEAGVTDFRKWDENSFRVYLTSAGKADDQWLVPWDYHNYRDTYQFGSQTPGKPFVFAIHPRTNEILLGSVPDGVYTVYGKYWAKPSVLEADDTEVPLNNPALHMLLVYRTMEYYGYEQSAAEILSRAADGWNDLYPTMELEELPDVTYGDGFG